MRRGEEGCVRNSVFFLQVNDIEERERGVGKEEKSKCELKLKEGIFVISPPIYPKSQLFYNQS